VFVSIKLLHVSVFFHDHLQGVLRCALCRYYSSLWFAFVEFVLLRSMWPHVYVICVCLVFLSVGEFTSRSPTDKKPNTHRWHKHAATYCVIIRTQRTQISGRNSNGTKHSGGHPEDGREKKTETSSGFILTNTFSIFYLF